VLEDSTNTDGQAAVKAKAAELTARFLVP
jgi:hypothetical protein